MTQLSTALSCRQEAWSGSCLCVRGLATAASVSPSPPPSKVCSTKGIAGVRKLCNHPGVLVTSIAKGAFWQLHQLNRIGKAWHQCPIIRCLHETYSGPVRGYQANFSFACEWSGSSAVRL